MGEKEGRIPPSDVELSNGNGVNAPNGAHSVETADAKKKKKVYVTPKESPEEHANVFSQLTFSWMNFLLMQGYRKPLEENDLPPLPECDQARVIGHQFTKAWDVEKKKRGLVVLALFRAFKLRLFIGGLLQLLTVLLGFTPPLFLNSILLYIENKPSQNFMSRIFGKYYGYYAAAALFLIPMIKTLVENQYFHHMFRLGIHVKTSLVEIVYQKALKLSNSARQAKSVGEIVTLMQVDTEKVSFTTSYLHVTWSALLQIFGNLALLYYYIGWSSLVGFAMLLVTIPTQGWLVNKLMSMQRAILLNTSKRVKIMNEVLQGMKVVKSYAWERPFKASIKEIRSRELAAMRKRVFLRAAQSCLMMATPVLIMVVTFSFYAGVAKRDMTAARVFTALSLFSALRFPLMFYPFVLNAVLAGHVSLMRIGGFLNLGELDPPSRDHNSSEEFMLTLENASFKWSSSPSDNKNGNKSTEKSASKGNSQIEPKKRKWGWGRKKGSKVVSKTGNSGEPSSPEEPFTLSNIDVRVPRGKLIAVVGPVGSGKSSLASAMLGEMEQISGPRVRINGSLAFCSQQAWILNATLKENILFGKEYDERKYLDVLSACALEQDLAILPNGDLTEIGERGINLSGGQKQRVALARAVYADTDIYLLDDPLSAVDAHVGTHLFNQCINGILSDKTRVFVTNQLHYVPAANWVIVLKDGRIVEQGTYQDVMSNEGEFAQLMKESGSHAEEMKEIQNSETNSKENNQKTGQKETKASDKGKLVQEEHRARGMLKLGVYKQYWSEASKIVPILVLLLYCISQGTDAFQRYWLAYWTKDQFDESTAFYLGLYAAIALSYSILVYFRTLSQALLGLWTSKLLHVGMLESILSAPMSFFDVTPVGRILNRFSADQTAVDEDLPFSWSMFLNIFFQVLSTIVVISLVTPIFIAVFFPLSFLYFFMQQIYRRTARELKRLESVSKSPVYQLFTETLNGLSIIRAYQQEERFLNICDAKLNVNIRPAFLLKCCDRWLSVRLETMGNILVSAAAFLAVSKKGSLYAGFAGISIDYALQITASLNMFVRTMTDTENQMNAVERMLEYRYKIDHEAPGDVEEFKPSDDWPDQGAIKIRDLSMRYRPELPLVLKNVSLDVSSGEKVGVVGRTGSGKSSLMLCLFRLVEPSSGTIYIDGVDILKIGLYQLRSRLSIIPQDPILFSGSIRSNLDPFEQFSDDQVWTALERAHLKDKVSNLAGKLASDVAEYGENLSVGERQLLCLARVLLRKSRILVMDEATSSVDYETDRLIQATIRSHLNDTTMLIIAHRINTVIDASRILLLADGEVCEYDSPANLLENPDGAFTSLVNGTGEQSAEHLKKIARGEVNFFSTYGKGSHTDLSSLEHKQLP